MQLSQQQEAARAEFRSFVERDIVPHADDFDRHQRLPTHVIRTLAERGYLGPSIPVEFGGLGWDLVLSGLFYEELGRACSSVRSLVTVNCMTAHAILRWGSQAQKQQWLPRIASGEIICGFALSEPTAGSDASTVETTAAPKDGAYVLNGTKKWITFGQIAGLFLVVSRCDGHHAAFLVDGNSPGLTREDITGLLGVRASMLAAIHLNGCTVGRDRMLGNLGFGFAPVATTAIEYGRYSVAWGSVGLAQACLDASVRHANTRKQFGRCLSDFQLIQQMIARMVCNVKAARALCHQASALKMSNDPGAYMEMNIAKYFASRVSFLCATDAVQIHGAVGCSEESSVQRYFRDAKVMEIIEGSTQIQEINIGSGVLRQNSSEG